MAINTIENPLLVLEFDGTGRSGKGTIVADTAAKHEGVATEETGGDYRVVTKVLLDSERIDPEMSKDTIQGIVGKLGVDEIAEIVAARPAIVSEHGLESLYVSSVGSTVSSISPIASVRKAVKAGFRKRVEAVVADDDHNILLVDGRNLKEVVRQIPETTLVLSTFTSCLPIEAAMREIARRGTETPDTFEVIYDEIEKRNRDDAQRTIDPVKPQDGALDYWYDQTALQFTIARATQLYYGGDETEAVRQMFSPSREFTDVPRYGVAALAMLSGKQIHFDTTYFRNYEKPKEAMLEAANIMFEEALALALEDGLISVE